MFQIRYIRGFAGQRFSILMIALAVSVLITMRSVWNLETTDMADHLLGSLRWFLAIALLAVMATSAVVVLRQLRRARQKGKDVDKPS